MIIQIVWNDGTISQEIIAGAVELRFVRICPTCEKEFTTTDPQQRYDRGVCASAAYVLRRMAKTNAIDRSPNSKL